MVEKVGHAEVGRLQQEGAQLVEVLPEEEYEALHISGAVSIPIKEMDAAAVESLDRDRPVIVYCNDTL